MGGRLSSPVLVGREDELGRLHEHAAAVREGRPAAVLLGGEAGIGKTRLLTEFTDALDGFTVLAGGCLDLGASALPHAPLVEALRSLARSQPEDALRRLFTGPRAGLRRLVPELARPSDAPSEVPGDAGAAALYEGVLSLLETLAGQAPVVLVMEDLHWATATTLDLLSFLVRNLAQVPVLVVGTFRSDELHVRDMLRPVVTELSRLPTVDRLDLAPLTERHLTRQVAEILGHPPDAELMRTVVERSEGNAFYAEELLAAAEGADRARLPDSLRDILLDRVARLDADGREVLGVAAVAGRRVDHELLAQVAELPADRLRAGLRGAVRSGLLLIEHDGSHYRFRHALLQEAAYSDLLPGERSRLHAAFVEALSTDPRLAVEGAEAVDAELAHHAIAARQVDLAFEASVRAAGRARALFAFDEAQGHLELALELEAAVGPGTRAAAPTRLQLLMRASEAASFAGDLRRAQRHLEVGLRGTTVTATERADLLQRLAKILFDAGEPDAALERTAEAVALEGVTPAVRARALAFRSHVLTAGRARPVEAIPVAREALAVARAAGARREEGEAAHSLGLALGMVGVPDMVEEGISWLRRSIEIGRAIDDPRLVLRGYNNLGATLALSTTRTSESGDVDREGLAYAESVGWHGPDPDFLRMNLAERMLEMGELTDAARLVDLVPRRVEPAIVVARHMGVAVPVRIHQGRAEDARELFDRTHEIAEHAGQPQFVELVLRCRAMVALADDDLAAAAAALAEVPRLEPARVRTGLWSLAARVAADGVTATGTRRPDEVVRARTTIEALASGVAAMRDSEPQETVWSRELELAALRIAAERTRVVGPPEPAAWEAAEEALVALARGAFDLAYLRIRRAEALVSLDRRDEAAALLSSVHADLRRRDEVWVAGLAAAVARRARIPLDGLEDHGADAFGLTPREREVLALVSLGLTNREIGERLFITDKTASVHVSNLMAKMDASTRGEAALIARRHGLDGASA